MKELLEDPEFQKLVPYLPYLYAGMALQFVVLLLLGNTIRTTLLLVKQENRLLVPFQALLLAVPLLNIFWNFVVLRSLRDSLNNEFYDRKVAVDENPTQKQGNIFAWSFLIANMPVPFIGFAASFAYIVGLIMYWVKIVEMKKLLKTTADLAPQDSEDTDTII